GEGGGRVRVGRANPEAPAIASAVDIPADQGGWVRLTFARSAYDDPTRLAPISIYGVWRRLPGTMAAGARVETRSPTRQRWPETSERVRSLLPMGLDLRQVDGHLYVTGPGSRPASPASSFPSGTWELLTSVPAVQRDQYVVAVPTISDAAPN